MHFLKLILLLAGGIRAYCNPYVVSHETPVFQSIGTNSRVLFTLKSGESVEGERTNDEDFYRVRVLREEKWRTGFVEATSLNHISGKPLARRGFAVGPGYWAASFVQKGKQFTGQDDVQYTTSDFTGSSNAPTLSLQWRDEDFWRLTITQFKSSLRSTATKNVSNLAKDFVLNQTFVAGVLQKAWTPFSIKNVYFGGGGFLAKSTQVDLQYGGAPLPTNGDDRPVYLGLQAFLGGHSFLASWLSAYVEVRVTDVLNQSPAILIYEGTGGILVWL